MARESLSTLEGHCHTAIIHVHVHYFTMHVTCHVSHVMSAVCQEIGMGRTVKLSLLRACVVAARNVSLCGSAVMR